MQHKYAIIGVHENIKIQKLLPSKNKFSCYPMWKYRLSDDSNVAKFVIPLLTSKRRISRHSATGRMAGECCFVTETTLVTIDICK
jgi:hypothetical protein